MRSFLVKHVKQFFSLAALASLAALLWTITLASSACSLPAMLAPQQQPAMQGPRPEPLAARFQLIDGSPKTLGDYKGQVIFVDFWATWCAPCRQAMPYYAELYQNFHHQGLALVAIGLDDDTDLVREFAERWNLPFDVATDGMHEAASAFSVSQLPTSFIIDKLGRVRFVHRGFDPERVRRLEEEIELLLSE